MEFLEAMINPFHEEHESVVRWYGKRFDMEAIRHRLAMGLSPTETARELGVSRGTVYKARAGMTDIA